MKGEKRKYFCNKSMKTEQGKLSLNVSLKNSKRSTYVYRETRICALKRTPAASEVYLPHQFML